MGFPIVLTFLASGVVGFVIGRWWAIVVPIGGLSLFYVGLNVGWWGYGVGEAWQVAMAYLMCVGVLGTVAGVAGRGFVMRRASSGAAPRLTR